MHVPDTAVAPCASCLPDTQEPELLRADGDRLRRQVQELAVSQYGAFIAAAESTSAVTKEVAAIRDHVRKLQQARVSPFSPAPPSLPH